MAGVLYLIDSNVLIHWVQRDDPDYQVVESAASEGSGIRDTVPEGRSGR